MDFSGLPPVIVQTGGAEVFVSENILLVERMRAAGVQVTHEIAENMVHVFQAFVMVSRDGQRAIDSLGRFVRDQAGTAPLRVDATVEPAEAPALPQPTP